MKQLSLAGRAYITTVIGLGLATIVHSALELYLQPVGWNWVVLAVLTLLSGSATVRLPSVPATISISETFVFTSVLLFGPAAGTLTVALDALVISLGLARRGHPKYRLVFNVCALPAALWVGAQVFFAVANIAPLSLTDDPVNISQLLLPLFLFTIIYFTLNSWLIAFAISSETLASPLAVWRRNFAWLSLNYFGGASIAALLVSYTRNIDYVYLAFVLPLLAILYFTFSVSMGRVEDANRHLVQLNKLYMSTIETLAMAIDAKDQITHGHIRRVQRYAVHLARAMGVTDPGQIKAIEAASLLHDMGKLAVPEHILNKPGKLTPAEFEKMKLHASVGADILSAIDFPYPVVPIVRHHHENWDGTGYPDKIAGSDIPIGARILSVVDCFDALTSDRPYRPRLSSQEAIRILLERRGSMYDPLVVDSFIQIHRDLEGEPTSIDTTAELPVLRPTTQTTNSAELNAERLNNITASSEEGLLLHDLAQSISGELSLMETGTRIANHLRRAIPASTVALFLYEQDSDELVVSHAAGDNTALFSGLRIPRGQRLSGWVAANQQSILNSDPALDLGDTARTLRSPLRSCLSAPVIFEHALVGVLTVYSTHKIAFTEDHRRVLETVCRQVAGSIQRAASVDKASPYRRDERPDIESLRLPDLGQLKQTTTAHLREMGTENHLTLVRIRFAAVGSPTGRPTHGRRNSEHLSSVIGIVRSILRSNEPIFGISDEAICILLPKTDSKSAQRVAKRISERFAEFHPDHRQSHGFALWIGVSTTSSETSTFESLLASAQACERPVLEGSDPRPSVH